MTWDPNKPANNESPALAPQQIRTNWARLQAMIAADHLFSAAISADQGYHRVVHWINQGDSPAYINGTGQTFTKNATVTVNTVNQTAAHLFHRTSDGTTLREAPITPVPILAFVNFNGTVAANNSAQTIRSSYNVSSVTRQGTTIGQYVVNFATALPSNAYAVSITGRRADSGDVNGWVVNTATFPNYGDAVSTTLLRIEFRNHNDTRQNVDMGSVIIFGG